MKTGTPPPPDLRDPRCPPPGTYPGGPPSVRVTPLRLAPRAWATAARPARASRAGHRHPGPLLAPYGRPPLHPTRPASPPDGARLSPRRIPTVNLHPDGQKNFRRRRREGRGGGLSRPPKWTGGGGGGRKAWDRARQSPTPRNHSPPEPTTALRPRISCPPPPTRALRCPTPRDFPPTTALRCPTPRGFLPTTAHHCPTPLRAAHHCPPGASAARDAERGVSGECRRRPPYV